MADVIRNKEMAGALQMVEKVPERSAAGASQNQEPVGFMGQGVSMKRFASLGIVFALSAGLSLAEQLTGWITDRQCAMSGQYAGDAHKKCLQEGSPMVFVNEADKKIYTLTAPEKAKDLIGRKVLVEG